jgi:predicted RNA binding protein YcfA (HicA-like mRNA interferase family)
MKVREVIALIEQDGGSLVRTRGDHRQYKHPTKPGLVTVSGHRNGDVHPKTLASILTQAGLNRVIMTFPPVGHEADRLQRREPVAAPTI